MAEIQHLVAGVFASRATAEAALETIRGMGPQLQTVIASSILVLAKNDRGEVGVSVIEIGSASGVDVAALAERVAANLSDAAGAPAGSPEELNVRATHLGHALNPGAVALGLFVDPQFAGRIQDGLRTAGARVLTDDELKRVGAGLGGAEGTNDLEAKAAAAPPAAAPAAPAVFDWQAENAYSLALQAFVYGFPYVFYAQTRYKWTNIPQDPVHVPYAPVNAFWHASEVIDATYHDGGCPNNDTLYSIAWVDLGKEPVILTVPEIEPDRYWSFQLAGFSSDNFAYVGQRVGSGAGHYALVGPDWHGDLPAGVTAVTPSSPTPWVLVLGRTLVNGVADLPAVHALQAQYRLTPLSLWGRPDAPRTERRDVYAPAAPNDDPLGPWKALNAMLAENPPPAHHEVLLRQFATIGIGPGLDPGDQPDAVKAALLRASGAGMLLLRQYFGGGSWATVVNGWRYPPPGEGRFGDEFLLRAACQALAGIAANDPEEAVYLINGTDDRGEPLTGAHRYEMTFPPGMEPPVDGLWSVTAYGADMNLIPNPIDRYSIGDRTPGVRKDADGGTTFFFQNESPGAENEANWLPTGSGAWFPILRLYVPRREVVDATWECPPLRRVD